jgi:hypothetical protein
MITVAPVDEDARKKIHEAGGTKSLFEWYTDMDPIVQLEALAALVRATAKTKHVVYPGCSHELFACYQVNLTLSYSVTADMVTR